MAKWLNVLKCCCFLWFSPCHYASILFALFTRFLLFVCLAQLIFPSAQIRFVVKWMFSIIETHSQTHTHTHTHTHTCILNVWMLFFLCLMLSAVSNYESAALWEKPFTDEFIWCANLCPLIRKLICIMVISLISLPLSLSLSLSLCFSLLRAEMGWKVIRALQDLLAFKVPLDPLEFLEMSDHQDLCVCVCAYVGF